MLKPKKDIKTQKRFCYITILLLQVSIVCYTQQIKLNLTFKATTITDAIKEISKQSKINILYNPYILPENFNITGVYKNITIEQALDTVLRNTQVYYKYFKNDIVLYKKNEAIVEKHNIRKPAPPKETTPEKKYILVTDTITYSIVTHDTVVTRLTEIVKVPVTDTIKVYDTVKVTKQVNMPVYTYKPRKQSLIMGVSLSQGVFYSQIHINNLQTDSSGIIKSALKEKSSNAICFNLLYKHKSWIFETGLGFSKQKYTLDYSNMVTEIINRIDTIDRYYNDIIGADTSWVYITENKPVEVSTFKNVLSDLTYQYISMPLFAGYSKTFKNTTFEFKAGVLIHYYLGSKGVYLTVSPENNVFVNKTKAPNSKFNIDVFGAVTVDYFLNDKFHIFVQPYFGYTTFSPGNKNIPYYSTNLQIGIQTGLRYYF